MKSLNSIYLTVVCTQKAETNIVVPVARVVVVAIRRTQVLRVVVPTAATNDAVAPGDGHSPKKDRISQISSVGVGYVGNNTSHGIG